jgi:hypothetical protein
LTRIGEAAGRLVLRGHRLQDIAGQRSVEWLIAELWRGFAQRNLSEPTVRRNLGAMRVAVFEDVLPLLPQASQLAPSRLCGCWSGQFPTAHWISLCG